MVKTVQEKIYTGFRPRASDNGAQTSGPNANPKTYVVTPSVATTSVTLNSASMSGRPAVLSSEKDRKISYKTLDVNATHNVTREMRNVIHHLNLGFLQSGCEA
jgi:hypothetical protein